MDFSSSWRSFCTTSFLLLKNSKSSTTSCVRCVLDETQRSQIGISHFSQRSLHCFEVCVRHFGQVGLELLFLIDTILCSLDSSKRCFPAHTAHKWTWQRSQYSFGAGVSQSWHLMMSWALNPVPLFMEP